MSTLTRPLPVYVASARRPSAAELVAEAAREVAGRLLLIRQLTRAAMRRGGVNTLLGNIWWVLDPMLQMPLYVLLVGVVLRAGTPDYPLFLFSAILPWKWFTSSVIDASMSVSSRDNLIKQVPFPKIVLPVSVMISVVPQFFVGFIPLLVMMVALYRPRITPFMLLLPVVMLVQLAFTMAIGILMSILSAFARDTGRLMGYVFRAWFFLSPALYAPERVDRLMSQHPALGYIFYLNPFTTLFEGYRAALYYGRWPDFGGLAVLFLVSLGLLALSTVAFKRLEPSLPKFL